MPNNNITRLNIKKIIKEYSISQYRKQAQFVNNLKVLDNVTNQEIDLKYNLKNKIRNDYLFKVFTSVYINNYFSKLNSYKSNSYQGIFITLTLPSKYHNLNNLDVIKEGYEQLNSTFRSIYNNFLVDDNKVNIKFIRVVEPHKSYVPHLHAIVYIEKKYINLFHNHLNNVLAPVKLQNINKTKFKSSKSYKNDIGRFEYELIDNINKCSAYLLKYVNKSLSADDTNLNYYHEINGWKTYFKIRNFTYSSGLAIPRYVFNRVAKTLKLEIGKDYNKGQNVLEVVEKLINIHQVVYDENNNAKFSKRLSKNAKYNVIIVKEKITRISYECFNDTVEPVTKIYYKIMEFQIIRISDKKILYDKSRYTLII